jgi:polysaccharide export outer membrane protein
MIRSKFQKLLQLTLLLVITSSGSSTVLAQSDDYRITPGDKISISVYGEKELSFSAVSIPNNGKFKYPFLGEILASGKTEFELANLISSRLKDGYLLDPQVTVSVASYRPIYIGGAISSIGRQPFAINMDVEKVIRVAGGLSAGANAEDISILRERNGESTEIEADLETEIFPGDVITIGYLPVEKVKEAQAKDYFYLYGEVRRPGRYEYSPGLSVEKAIVIAGGFGQRASKRKISVSRGNPAVIEKKVPLEYPIKPGDVITIGASLF